MKHRAPCVVVIPTEELWSLHYVISTDSQWSQISTDCDPQLALTIVKSCDPYM
jgi:hypothetical protein